jgi:hypothetical protein
VEIENLGLSLKGAKRCQKRKRMGLSCRPQVIANQRFMVHDGGETNATKYA